MHHLRCAFRALRYLVRAIATRTADFPGTKTHEFDD